MNFRFGILISATFAIFGLLILNLYNLQVKQGVFYSARAESQYRLSGLLEPRRGIIYFTDKNDNLIPAALNKQYPIVFASPKEIEDADRATELLSEVLGLKTDELNKKLIKKNSYEVLAVKINDEQISKIKELNLKGVYLDLKEFRYYPYEHLAAHVLGFVGLSGGDTEMKGRYGLEAYYDKVLHGERGEIKGEKVTEAVHGEDLILTLDRNIQARSEEILSKIVASSQAEGGSVIVEEPKTGKILALASNPTFNPNNYSKYDIKNFLNPTVQALYEPGSVIKVITMAAGIDSGKLDPDTRFYDNGSVTFNGKTIKNYKEKAYGSVTMREVIEESINTGAVFAVRRGGQQNFYNYAVKFGFKDRTGINLPGEVKGSLRSLEVNPRDINFATAAFGQGIALTPIALISALGAIGNKGILMKPYLLAAEKPQELRRVIKPETALQVKTMMTSAVKKAKIAQIPEFEVAGKTGTAQIPDLENGGYKDEFIHTFGGFAPASDPRFAILIKLDKPAGSHPAAVTVVPAFRELAEFILNYYNVPPDNLEISD